MASPNSITMIRVVMNVTHGRYPFANSSSPYQIVSIRYAPCQPPSNQLTGAGHLNIGVVLKNSDSLIAKKVNLLMTTPPCPKCQSTYVYEDQQILICPECAYEWNPNELVNEDEFTVKDSNGNVLQVGDKVTIIKDLKVKGSSQGLKVGTKTTIRRIVEGKDHELSCKFAGIGEIMVTAAYVKKA